MLNQFTSPIFQARVNGSIFRSLQNQVNKLNQNQKAGEQVEPELEGIQYAQECKHHNEWFKCIMPYYACNPVLAELILFLIQSVHLFH